MPTFTLDVTHAQLAVFDAHLSRPFNDWSDAHVAQGFAWRPGSVSFATLEPSGEALVDVRKSITTNLSYDSGARRAIVVPFSVPLHGTIEVATIVASTTVKLTPGEYELSFIHGQQTSGTMWVLLNFRPVTIRVNPQILFADPTLSCPEEFIMHAEPA